MLSPAGPPPATPSPPPARARQGGKNTSPPASPTRSSTHPPSPPQRAYATRLTYVPDIDGARVRTVTMVPGDGIGKKKGGRGGGGGEALCFFVKTPVVSTPHAPPSPFPPSPFALGPEIAECVEAALEKLRVPIVWERFPHIHGAKNGLPVEDVDEDLVESIKRNRVCFKGKRRRERERERGDRGRARKGRQGESERKGRQGGGPTHCGKLTLLPPPPPPVLGTLFTPLSATNTSTQSYNVRLRKALDLHINLVQVREREGGRETGRASRA